MASLTNIKPYLKAIEEGDFDNFDMLSFTKMFQSRAANYGDHLQFVLHKFCKQSVKEEVEVNVVSLCELCFTKESVAGFKHMDRFLGSLFYITSYLLKRHNYSLALQISNSVDVKKTEIEECAVENTATRNILYNLHSVFITTAQEIASKIGDVDRCCKEIQLSYQLAQMSIKFLHLMKFKQVSIGKKLFRNFKNYFNTLKSYDKRNIYRLYKEMEEALYNIMPMYNNKNFLYYYLIKMDLIENEEKMELSGLNKCFRKNAELIFLWENDSKSFQLWNALLSTDSLDEKYLKIFARAAEKIVASSQSNVNQLMFSIFFNHCVQLWIKHYSNEWLEIFTSRVIEQIYTKMLLPIKSVLRNQEEFFSLSFQMESCFLDLYETNLIRLLHMIRLCLKYDVPMSLDLVKISREIFSYILVSMKESTSSCCIMWRKQLWNNLVINYTNMVECLWKQADSDKVWTYIKDCCEELLDEITHKEFESPYDCKRIKLLFQRWHYACIKLKEYDEALFVCTLLLVSYPQEDEDGTSMWIQTKKCLSADPRQLLTFKDVIDREKARIENMKPKAEHIDLKQLLLMELRAYSTCPSLDTNSSKSGMTLLSKVWDMLKKMDLELCDRAAALHKALSAAIFSGDSESMKKYKKECEDVVAEILRSKDSRHCRNLLYAGNLKYGLFFCRMRSIQEVEDKSNSSKSILEFLKREEEEKVKFGEDVDLNLTCNVMPSTNHFTVSFEENYLSALNEILSFWEEASKRAEAGSLEPHEFSTWLLNIIHLSQMYYLIGDVHQSFVSWMLCYQIAKVSLNHSAILLALSHIIPECTNVEDTKLLMEAEEIADELSSEGKEKDILILYWLAAGSNYLKNRNKTECLSYLCKVKNSISQVKDHARYHICSARYWSLVSKFLVLYYDQLDKFDLEPETELTSVVFKAFSHANTGVKDESMNSLGSKKYMEILTTMLDVNVWAFDFFAVYSQAAFMRFFLDDLYQIFQKLVLPTRTAFILSLLTEVDVMCEKVEEATTKLNTLKQILGRTHASSVEEEKKSDVLEVPRSVEEEAESPRPMSPTRFLDVTNAYEERDPSPLRYVLREVDLVRRLDHVGKCDCYACRSLLIKFLCVNVSLLEARVCHINGSKRKSCSHYGDGYRNLKKLESYQKKLSEGLSRAAEDVDGIVDFQGNLIRFNSVKFNIHYALFVLSAWREEKVGEVEKMIGKIGRAMESFSYEEKLLQWKVVELDLACFAIQEMNAEEAEEERKIAPRVIRSPNRVPAKTPVAGRKPRQAGAPFKYKQAKVAKSPNSFGSRPIGKKIFGNDEDGE